MVALFAFDIGYGISLDRVASPLASTRVQPLSQKKRTPPYHQYARPPHRVNLERAGGILDSDGSVAQWHRQSYLYRYQSLNRLTTFGGIHENRFFRAWIRFVPFTRRLGTGGVYRQVESSDRSQESSRRALSAWVRPFIRKQNKTPKDSNLQPCVRWQGLPRYARRPLTGKQMESELIQNRIYVVSRLATN